MRKRQPDAGARPAAPLRESKVGYLTKHTALPCSGHCGNWWTALPCRGHCGNWWTVLACITQAGAVQVGCWAGPFCCS